MAKRKYVDWDSIEPLYRAGTLSLHEICAQYKEDHKHSQTWKITVHHSAIVKHAKRKSWTRNLAKKVQERIKEKLVTNLLTTCDKDPKNKLSDDEMVEQAAEAGTKVIVRHRVEIKALLAQEDALLSELESKPTKLYLANYQGKIMNKTIGLTVTEKSVTLKNLAGVRAQRIALERQAHNISDDTREEDKAELLKEISKQFPR